MLFRSDTNRDVDGDRKADLSIDLDGDKVADFNFDVNNDGKPDVDVLGVKYDNGAFVFTPADLEMIVDKFADKTDLTLKLDNFGEYVNGVEFPKEGLAYCGYLLK